MKVVILGGNECMERQYKDICEEYCGQAGPDDLLYRRIIPQSPEKRSV